jgi:AraC-like DNA-binding protein
MKIQIKNMLTLRCIICVKAILDKLGIPFREVELGQATLQHAVPPAELDKLRRELEAIDLYIIEDRKDILIERIKQAVTRMMEEQDAPRKNYSVYIGDKLGYNYAYLANVFSQHTGTTIEHYIIMHKVERVKLLLSDNSLTLTQIAAKLNYCSVPHLSAQFKKLTGLTPSEYRHKLRQLL